MSAVLEAEGLGVTIRDGGRDRILFAGTSLALSPGEVALITGPSGSGKSTLLATLAGLGRPTEGDVRLEGRSLVHMRDHHRAAHRRHRVGFTFQTPALLPGLPALANILAGYAPDGGPDEAARARAAELVSRFELDAVANAPIERLSGGERARVSLARALVREPALLALDEPSAHLDPGRAGVLGAALEAHRARGGVAVLTTHDPRLIESLDGATRYALASGSLGRV